MSIDEYEGMHLGAFGRHRHRHRCTARQEAASFFGRACGFLDAREYSTGNISYIRKPWQKWWRQEGSISRQGRRRGNFGVKPCGMPASGCSS